MQDTRDDVIGSALDWVSALFRRWRILLTLPLVAAAASAAVSVAKGQVFASVSRFAPERSDNTATRLGGLASQFGLSASLGGSTESLEFYAEVLRSRNLLASVAQAPLKKNDGSIVSYIDLYGEGESEHEKLTSATDVLTKNVNVSIDHEPQLLSIRTLSDDPGIALALNQSLLARLSEFNQKKRQSRATAERLFLEGRLKDTRAELQRAESEMVAFLSANRMYDSPAKDVQREGLQRRVGLASEMTTTLSQSYEQARIDEVRNTPVITIIDDPAGNVRPTRSLVKDAIFGFVVGFAIACGVVLLMEYKARERARMAAALRVRTTEA